jgi:hypothetical protein
MYSKMCCVDGAIVHSSASLSLQQQQQQSTHHRDCKEGVVGCVWEENYLGPLLVPPENDNTLEIQASGVVMAMKES